MKLYKQNKFIKLKNINNSYKNSYNRRYIFAGIKFTIKNKEKFDFYIQKKREKALSIFREKYEPTLKFLNSKRQNLTPLLTIYLLTYNHQETIEKCIQSILIQNTKYSYIITILDDASNDGTSDICLEYAKKYPEQIEYILQPFNTRGKHFSDAIKKISTKYWCYIDGDDWWLTDDKIEKALDFLEEHEDYVMYTHDYQQLTNDTDYSTVHDYYKLPDGNQDISFDNFTYIHPSARICKNCIDWNVEYKKIIKSDYPIFILTMSKGRCFFEDEKQSIWNFNNKGFYSSKSTYLRAYYDLLLDYALNKTLKFKYNSFFVEKQKNYIKINKIATFILGYNLIWKISLWKCKRNALKNEIKNLKADYINVENRFKLKEQ